MHFVAALTPDISSVVRVSEYSFLALAFLSDYFSEDSKAIHLVQPDSQ